MKPANLKFETEKQIKARVNWTANLPLLESPQNAPKRCSQQFGACYYEGKFQLAGLLPINTKEVPQGYAWIKFANSKGYALFYVCADHNDESIFNLSI